MKLEKRTLIEAIELTVLLITLHIGLALVIDAAIQREIRFRTKRGSSAG